MDHSTAAALAANPRLKIEHDPRGWTSVTISPDCRNTLEYYETVKHALRHGLPVPRPKHRAERAILAIKFPEVVEAFIEAGDQW